MFAKLFRVDFIVLSFYSETRFVGIILVPSIINVLSTEMDLKLICEFTLNLFLSPYTHTHTHSAMKLVTIGPVLL